MTALLLIGATLVLAVSAKKLPDSFPQCKRSDPNFDKCVINAVEVVRPQLIKGIPKIRVPAADPFVIPKLNINRDQPNLKIKANLKNIVAKGGSAFKIQRLKTDLNKLTLEAQVVLPKIQVTCDYDVDGRLLVVPLKGVGIFKGNFTNIIVDIKGVGEMVKSKKGTEYVQIKTIKLKLKMGAESVKFKNTDNNANNDLIATTAANFVNQNRDQVFEIVTPIAEETAEAIAKQIGNPIFRAIPFSEIVLD
uniref:Circadian clock-controlled protein n=1 Tax=Lygus hesperus TaxID=30085 RepID=A0A0A9XEC2_LYGHE